MKILTCFQYIFPFLHDFYVQPFLAYSLEACGFCFVNLYLFANTQIKNAKLIFLIRSTLKFFHVFKSNSYWYEYLLRAITRIWYLQDLIIFPTHRHVYSQSLRKTLKGWFKSERKCGFKLTAGGRDACCRQGGAILQKEYRHRIEWGREGPPDNGAGIRWNVAISLCWSMGCRPWFTVHFV